jgi:hypothetical protein
MRKGKGIRGVRGKGIVDIANKVIDILPSNNKLARSSYPGEKHAILQNPNGTFSRANWMGPSTNVRARVQRGDKGIVPTDTVSKMHDLQYSVAKDKSDIRSADNRMLKSLDRLEKGKKDSKFNTKLGKAVIGAKVKLEDMGLPNSFGDIKEISDEDRKMYEDEIDNLAKMGYGLKKLRKTAMKNYKKNNDKKQHIKSVPREFKGRDSNVKAFVKLDNDMVAEKSGKGFDIVKGFKETVKKALPSAEKAIGFKVPSSVLDAVNMHIDKYLKPNNVSSVMEDVMKIMKAGVQSKVEGKGGKLEIGAGWWSDFTDGFSFGWNKTKSLLENVPAIEGVDVGAIAKKIPNIPGPTSMDDLKERKRIRDKDEANRAQADLDEIEQKKNSRPLTEKEKENVKSFLEQQKNIIDKLKAGKGYGKGGEFNMEELNNISKMLVEKMKNKPNMKVETFKDKVKRYLPTIGKSALAIVTALAAKKLFSKANEKVAEFIVDKGIEDTKELWSKSMNKGKGNSVGKGINLPGKGEGEFDMETFNNISKMLVEKLKNKQLEPETFKDKVKKYLPTIGKVGLAVVTALAAKKLFSKPVGEFFFNQGVKEFGKLTKGKGVFTSGGKKKKGKGIFTSGGKMESEDKEMQIMKGYKDLRKKILLKNLE